MLVQAPVGNVTFMCPPAVATFEEFSCNATFFRGTYLSVHIDWDDLSSAQATEQFHIAGQSSHWDDPTWVQAPEQSFSCETFIVFTINCPIRTPNIHVR